MYAHARGQRSSREIERACVEDDTFRLITVNEVPDHTTVARFRPAKQRLDEQRAAEARPIPRSRPAA